MSNDGFFFDMNEDVESNDEPEFSNKIFMSHDDLLKFLQMDDMDNGETNENNVVTPLGVDFNKLRGHMTDLLGNGMVSLEIKSVTQNIFFYKTFKYYQSYELSNQNLLKPAVIQLNTHSFYKKSNQFINFLKFNSFKKKNFVGNEICTTRRSGREN